MFRKVLLATTALLCIASLSCVASAREVVAAPGMQDANQEFLCNYGGLQVSAYYSSSGSSYYSAWTHVAVPITGHGQTVKKIMVRQQMEVTYSEGFSAGIYSNTASGFPGKLIAGGQHQRLHATCKTVTLTIPATTLTRNTTYWIEETTARPVHGSNTTYWAIEKGTNRRAYEQVHRHELQSSSTSPWTPLSATPYFRLR